MALSLSNYHMKEYHLETEVRKARDQVERSRATGEIVDQTIMVQTAMKWLVDNYVNEPFSLHKLMEQFEYFLISRAFDLNKNVVKSAEFMGVNRSTLSMKVSKKGFQDLAEQQKIRRKKESNQ